MQSLAHATKLLDNCADPKGLVEVFRELGFVTGPIELTPEEAGSIGLPENEGPFSILQGQGGLRAILFDVKERGQLRLVVAQIAARVVSRAPHLLWILGALDIGGGEVGIAACDPGKSKARVAALVARPGHIVASDAETLCTLAAARAESDMLVHARWLEILGRESVSRRFFRALEASIANLSADLFPAPSAAHASEMALLYASRLLFLSFLETKGWLDRDHGFLGNTFADCMMSGGGFHKRVLMPLFFGTLNTHPRNRAARAQSFGRVPFLNGGLFSRSSVERGSPDSQFSDEALGGLFADVLSRYRFTAREDTSAWSESAVDPEILGRAFESLMSARTRKTSGAFYTPQSLVVDLTRSALSNALSSDIASAECVKGALAGEPVAQRTAQQLLGALGSFRILDPACGSGAFLVHALEELSALRQHVGDPRPLHEIRRSVLTRSIFGVDVNPTAVWLCELRLWLSMAIENPQTDPMRVSTLPNLDRHIRFGDSLLADSFENTRRSHDAVRFATLRSRYSRATGPRKRSLGRMLDRAERTRAIGVLAANAQRAAEQRHDLLLAIRSRDLFGKRNAISAETKSTLIEIRDRLRSARRDSRALAAGAALPFSFPTHFADAAVEGGFHVVIGNPPWIRTHNLDRSSRVQLRRSYSVYRNAAWKNGAEAAGAGRGFSGQVDTAALFVERSLSLCRCGGVVALIVPAKLWRSLAGGGVRSLILDGTQMIELQDLTDAKQIFDAAVYPSTIVIRQGASANSETLTVAVAVHHARRVSRWNARQDRIAFDDSRGSPWVMLPSAARRCFDTISAAGIPLSRSSIGRPTLGVKSGCNEAFIPPAGKVEKAMLRPLVRGENLCRWRVESSSEQIIWTHDEAGAPLRSLPPRTLEWLSGFRETLDTRSDARGRGRWWSLFRIDSSDFSRPRVVWSDVARAPAAALIPAGDNSVAINSCYVVRCPALPDALALVALLNSPVSAAWLNAVAEPARGGYHRYLGWTMSILPTPRDWSRAASILAPVAQRAIDGFAPPEDELTSATLEAFGLCHDDVAELLEWDDA